MAWRSIPKSRYGIRYIEQSNKLEFYLMGATHEDRQKKYRAITQLIASLKNDGEASFISNGDLWQDLSTDIFKFELVSDETGYVKVRAIPKECYKGVLGDEINLGIIPSENNFSRSLFELYQTWNQDEREARIKLGGVRFNAWDGSVILIKMIVDTSTELDSKEESTESLDAVDEGNQEEDSAVILSDVPNFNLKFPFALDIDNWEDFRRLAFANVSSLYFIKQLSRGLDDTCAT